MCEFLTPSPSTTASVRITPFSALVVWKTKKDKRILLFVTPTWTGRFLISHYLIAVKGRKSSFAIYQPRYGSGASIKINNSEEPEYGDMARGGSWRVWRVRKRAGEGGTSGAVIAEGPWRWASAVTWSCFKEDRPEEKALQVNAPVTWPRLPVTTTYLFNQWGEPIQNWAGVLRSSHEAKDTERGKQRFVVVSRTQAGEMNLCPEDLIIHRVPLYVRGFFNVLREGLYDTLFAKAVL